MVHFEQCVGSAIDSANSSSPDHSMDLSLFFATSERTRYGQRPGFFGSGKREHFLFDGERALAGMHTCTYFTRLSLVM